ncbi:MAG TPA: aspartate--tRNA ligase [Bacteroidales bacterium]|nr:aspartate--tRNA ligase [Bacteroidales bacterium]HSA43193.1 aspartate--tRNA ligase [Bacteroidales bacterium]
MLRTNNCGELRLDDKGRSVTLSGWVQKSRDLGGMTFIDLRDRYGITQLVFNMESDAALCGEARKLGREWVIRAKGTVAERSNKNPKMPTGDIEILVESFEVLNVSKLPPFTIENETDGGDELRMRYRYLDLRRPVLRDHMILRHRMAFETRNYLDSQGFLEIETPYMIKSTPEGARDFVVPSRMNPGEFYALPQSPQTFKQILMVAGYDRYFQIVRCFRDEDLRADRQPEFTQIDCEMSFVTQDDILETFEGLARHLFRSVLHLDQHAFPRMSWEDAMRRYGSDKPDLRFGMEFVEITDLVKGKAFRLFDDAELVAGITVPGCAEYSRKQLDELTEFVRKPQIGAGGLVYIKHGADGSLKSSIDKFFGQEDLSRLAETMQAKAGDLMLILSGPAVKTRKALCELRLEMGNRLGLRDNNCFKPMWVVDFPLLEWDEETGRYYAMHHPFTAPKPEDIPLLDVNPALVKANAYDLVINGVEIGGGSIRIHEKDLQNKMLSILGFSEEEAVKQFGFLMNAFEYGAPPHGGIAFGFDRWCALFGGQESIRDFIAFPKNNAGRDMMIDAPSTISREQLDELHLSVNKAAEKSDQTEASQA